MRCSFCATGAGGFARGLSPAEIVDQVLTVQEAFGQQRVSNVGAPHRIPAVHGCQTRIILHPQLAQAPSFYWRWPSLHKLQHEGPFNTSQEQPVMLLFPAHVWLWTVNCLTTQLHREVTQAVLAAPQSRLRSGQKSHALCVCSVHGHGRAAAQPAVGAARPSSADPRPGHR